MAETMVNPTARETNPKVDSIPAFAFPVAASKLVAKKRAPDSTNMGVREWLRTLVRK